MQRFETQMDIVIEALGILPQEPIDAKILAELVDLSPKQTSYGLSVLHCTGYLARIGTTNERYALYIEIQQRVVVVHAILCLVHSGPELGVVSNVVLIGADKVSE